jgi:hypothetical protein
MPKRRAPRRSLPHRDSGTPEIPREIHGAVVFAIAAAACRQIRLAQRGGGNERRKQRHSEDCQQRNGESLSQDISI